MACYLKQVVLYINLKIANMFPGKITKEYKDAKEMQKAF